jgi:transcriptional regulator with XRE-family HTH domain
MCMTTSYAPFLKHLRETRGFSQAEIASHVHMSRPSYVAVEKGTKELTLKEAEALARIFGITLDQILTAQAPDYEKYKQMLRAFLREAQKSGKTLKKTKLAKLLYLADFAWYYKHFESMSGMSYRKIDFGPVPDSYFSVVEEMEHNGELNITQVIREDYHMYEIRETRATYTKLLERISKEEQKLISEIWTKWKDAKTPEIVGFTHRQLPYTLCRPNEIIPYELITQVEHDEVY